MHQVGAGPGEKIGRDLVQRKRRNKGLRVFVHQSGAGRRPITLASGPIAPASSPAAYSPLNR